MDQPTFTGAFNNYGHGVQNVNNGKSQYNNNSNGTQYNDCTAEILRSLAFPEMLTRREGIRRRHANTCQWILELEEYKSWMDRSQALLWIKGKPGAGKSTLMEFLYNELKGPQGMGLGTQLEFFFTARGTELQRTPLGMLRSLLNQLFLCDATVRPLVRAAYMEQRVKFGGEHSWEWPQKLLEDLLAKAILTSAAHQQVTLFVDALDETGETFAQQLLDYLHQLNCSGHRARVTLKICFSCRHYPIVNSDETIEITVEHHNFRDIASYITDKFPRRVHDQEEWQRLANVLIKQANGVFQWVHIIMPTIQQKILRRHSPKDIRKWSRTVPSELEEMYLDTLERVMTIENPQEVFLFFQWLCAAERPLSKTEMRYALSTKDATIQPSQPWEQIDEFIKDDEDMDVKIQALSGGLAEIGFYREDTAILVVHQTVHDFLRNKGLLHLRSKVVDKSAPTIDSKEMILQCHATLYQSCLVYFIREALPEHEKGKGFSQVPFLFYATMNLFVHAEKAGSSRRTVNLFSQAEMHKCPHSHVLHDEVQTLRDLLDRWLNISKMARVVNQYLGWIDREEYYRDGRIGDRKEHHRYGTTLFHMAAAANMVDVLDYLIRNNEDIDQTDIGEQSAFHLAARHGHIKVAEMLKKKGADYDRKSNPGGTPLEEAAEHGQAEFVEWLLNNGFTIETRSRKAGSALLAASLSRRRDTVNFLIRAGADVNTQGGRYGNALQAAASTGSAELVWILITAGAEINTQGGEYGNALQAASWAGSAEVVRILIKAGAKVNAQGGKYGNALQAAASMRRGDVMQLLIDAEADVNAQGGIHGSALQAAVGREDVELVQMLLDAGAGINIQGGEYGNALQIAAWLGSAELVRILIKAGADVNTQGGKFGNALKAAAAGQGDTGVVQILLKAGAKIITHGGEYGNAMQAAASKGDAEMVRQLLNAGDLIPTPIKKPEMTMRKRGLEQIIMSLAGDRVLWSAN
ncbi:hypothetical protein N7489_003351 [Penicillium chrysogenum]|uniref:uncharacterized protein n=1 Tax=Penicillium chrysogenum TaxID=5076 RepID=UPI0024DF24C2|nr:uncharacterized protein N7489_003351 [Penicillium chrysogenum]KAJ5252941.1 hypothetical protein N7489_003351 [Penicillium chrysogenum]